MIEISCLNLSKIVVSVLNKTYLSLEFRWTALFANNHINVAILAITMTKQL